MSTSCLLRRVIASPASPAGARASPLRPRPSPLRAVAVRTRRLQTVTPSARASAAGGAASEFPEDPPASAVTYRQLAPHVELARAERVAGGASTSRAHAPSPALPVLVGWFGCKPSHLRKYAKMYLSEKLGYDAVVCVTPPVAATLFPALGDAFAATALGAVAHARKILAEEDAEGKSASRVSAPVALGPACALDERPLILHLFSNGGYVFAGNVMHAQTGFVADTETPLGASITTVLRRRLGFAPEPAAAARFSDSVAALVMDSAPGELEPGMVAASFRSVLTGSRAEIVAPDESTENTPFLTPDEGFKNGVGASEDAFASVAAAALAWRPIAKRLRYVDAAWGGFAAVTGNGWSGDCESRPGNAAEVAHAVAEKKLRRLKAEAQQMRDEQTRGDARGERRDAVAAARPARASPGTTIENGGLLKCPALFLYSAADALIPPEGVEAFAAARARRLGTVSSASTEGAGAGGGRVVLRRWESAAHCEIGKDHPEAYAAALRAFLGRAPDDGSSDGSSAASPESGSGAANNIKPFVRPAVDRRPAAARDADAAVAETTEQ